MKNAIRLLLIIIVFGLVGCSKSENKMNEIDKDKEEIVEKISSIEDITKEISSAVIENFSDFNPSISYDNNNNMLNITIVAPEGTTNAILISPDSIRDTWTALTESLIGMTKAGYEMYQINNYEVACTFMILSDANKDNCLFAAMNGAQYYNILDE